MSAETCTLYGYTALWIPDLEVIGNDHVTVNNNGPDSSYNYGLPIGSIKIHDGSQQISFPNYINDGTNELQAAVFSREWQVYSVNNNHSINIDISEMPTEFTLDPDAQNTDGFHPHTTYEFYDIFTMIGLATDGNGYASGTSPNTYLLSQFSTRYTRLNTDISQNTRYNITTGQTSDSNNIDIVPVYKKKNTRKLRINSQRTDSGPDLSELGFSVSVLERTTGSLVTNNIEFDTDVFVHNNSIQLTFFSLGINPVSGYGISFFGWYDGDTLISDQAQITIPSQSGVFPGDINITAKYALVCDLNWVSDYGDAGTVYVYYDGREHEPGVQPRKVPYGTEMQIQAEPGPGYFFARWSGAPQNWPNLSDITVIHTTPADFQAVFAQEPSSQIIKIL